MPEDNLGDPIPRDEPFVVPATPEQTFDSVWLRSINIYAPNTAEADPTQGSINVEMLPYDAENKNCLLYTSPSPRDVEESRMPSSA